MLLLLPSAFAYITFDPPSSAPSLAPWQGHQRYAVQAGAVLGLGGDGTTLSDSDFPGPGFLDAYLDLQLGGQWHAADRLDLIATAWLGNGSALGGGLGLRLWALPEGPLRVGLQGDLGLLYARAALPVTFSLNDRVALTTGPALLAAAGSQAQLPVGLSWSHARLPALVFSAELGVAVNPFWQWLPEYDEGLRYYGAFSAGWRFDGPPAMELLQPATGG